MDENVTSTTSVSFDQAIIDELFQLSPPPPLPIIHHQMIDDRVDELMMILAASPADNNLRHVMLPAAGDGSTEKLISKLDDQSSSTKKRTVVHRDVERRRRQEMSLLCHSLRSSLPRELLKGKRSTADHIHEAVRYIKHLKNKIRGLNGKKDDHLKRLLPIHDQLDNNPDPTNLIYTPPEFLNHQMGSSTANMVKINQCMEGPEIVIDADSKRPFSLSRVLDFLTREEGLTVVSCTSTRVNERLLHSIKSEVTDERSVELSELQPRLINFITYYC